MLELHVMYGDLSKRVAPLDALDTLPREDVLWLVIKNPERPSGKRMVRQLWGAFSRVGYTKFEDPDCEPPWYAHDHYAVGLIDDSYFTAAWEDVDDTVLLRDVNTGALRDEHIPMPRRFPDNVTLFVFHGRTVDDLVWKRSLLALAEERLS